MKPPTPSIKARLLSYRLTHEDIAPVYQEEFPEFTMKKSSSAATNALTYVSLLIANDAGGWAFGISKSPNEDLSEPVTTFAAMTVTTLTTGISTIKTYLEKAKAASPDSRVVFIGYSVPNPVLKQGFEEMLSGIFPEADLELFDKTDEISPVYREVRHFATCIKDHKDMERESGTWTPRDSCDRIIVQSAWVNHFPHIEQVLREASIRMEGDLEGF